jgi:hypothetical protein
MSADMSKKASVVVAAAGKNLPTKGKLYNSVRDCLTRTQDQSGVL